MTNGSRGERIGTEESPGSETSNERHGTANAEECNSSPIDSNHDGRSARNIDLFASVQRRDGWSL
jgi:hypothetical protein